MQYFMTFQLAGLSKWHILIAWQHEEFASCSFTTNKTILEQSFWSEWGSVYGVLSYSLVLCMKRVWWIDCKTEQEKYSWWSLSVNGFRHIVKKIIEFWIKFYINCRIINSSTTILENYIFFMSLNVCIIDFGNSQNLLNGHFAYIFFSFILKTK